MLEKRTGLTENAEKRKETHSKPRKFRCTHNPEHRQVYTESRSEYIALLKQKEKEYKQNKSKILAEEINNPQAFWKELRKCAGSRASHTISKRIYRQMNGLTILANWLTLMTERRNMLMGKL